MTTPPTDKLKSDPESQSPLTRTQRLRQMASAGMDIATDGAKSALQTIQTLAAQAPETTQAAVTVARGAAVATAAFAIQNKAILRAALKGTKLAVEAFANETVPAAMETIAETASNCGSIACDAASAVASATGSVMDIAGTAAEQTMSIAQSAASVMGDAVEVAGSLAESAAELLS